MVTDDCCTFALFLLNLYINNRYYVLYLLLFIKKGGGNRPGEALTTDSVQQRNTVPHSTFALYASGYLYR